MKSFDIPGFYRSSFIGSIKNVRKASDPRKKDFSPTRLDFGPVSFYLARHFGFCYGVENAIELSYRALKENRDKRIFLLSQMIHNPHVNEDLQNNGIRFIQDTHGNQITPWDELQAEDIVIVPAFGTTREIAHMLEGKGVETKAYNTTCPFVEKVWKMANKLGEDDFTIIIHGKFGHEETRATFSHSYANSPSVVVLDLAEAKVIGDIILGNRKPEEFYTFFQGKYSEGFDVSRHLEKVGVINQTTMLASETHEIAEYFKTVMATKYSNGPIRDHYADTRDTLCYATNDNQQATYALLETNADLAIVIGGYNSSNTSHLVELCEEKFPTYFISSADDILNGNSIRHFLYKEKKMTETTGFLPDNRPLQVIVTSGASCPDTMVEAVIDKLLSFFSNTISKEKAMKNLNVTAG